MVKLSPSEAQEAYEAKQEQLIKRLQEKRVAAFKPKSIESKYDDEDDDPRIKRPMSSSDLYAKAEKERIKHAVDSYSLKGDYGPSVGKSFKSDVPVVSSETSTRGGLPVNRKVDSLVVQTLVNDIILNAEALASAFGMQVRQGGYKQTPNGWTVELSIKPLPASARVAPIKIQEHAVESVELASEKPVAVVSGESPSSKGTIEADYDDWAPTIKKHKKPLRLKAKRKR